MPSRTVHVVAHFAVKPEHVDAFIRAAHATIVLPSRRDAGCSRYDLCQDANDPSRFAMIEEWESEDALRAHLGHPWLQDAVAKLGPMAAEQPRVHHLRPVPAAA
jgi:quinol monooxygenase YgiN